MRRRPMRYAYTRTACQQVECPDQTAERAAPLVGSRQVEGRCQGGLIGALDVFPSGKQARPQLPLGIARVLGFRMGQSIGANAPLSAKRFDGGKEPGLILTL